MSYVNAVMKMPTLADMRKAFRSSGFDDIFVDMTMEAKRYLEARMRDYIHIDAHSYKSDVGRSGGNAHLIRAVSIKKTANLDWHVYLNPTKEDTSQFYNLSYLQPSNSGGTWYKFENPYTGTPQSMNTTLAIEVGWAGYQWKGHSVGGYSGSHPIMNALRIAEEANIYCYIFARKLRAAGFEAKVIR